MSAHSENEKPQCTDAGLMFNTLLRAPRASETTTDETMCCCCLVHAGRQTEALGTGAATFLQRLTMWVGGATNRNPAYHATSVTLHCVPAPNASHL